MNEASPKNVEYRPYEIFIVRVHHEKQTFTIPPDVHHHCCLVYYAILIWTARRSDFDGSEPRIGCKDRWSPMVVHDRTTIGDASHSEVVAFGLSTVCPCLIELCEITQITPLVLHVA